VQIAEKRLKPNLDPEPENSPEPVLFVASHRGRRRHLANVFVSSKILQPSDQIAILAHLQSFIETTDTQEVVLPANDHTRTATVERPAMKEVFNGVSQTISERLTVWLPLNRSGI